MTEAQFARCCVCSAKVRVRLDGTLHSHPENGMRCEGTQQPPVDLSTRPDSLMSIASILDSGVLEALARGTTPEDLRTALQPTFRVIRRIAAAAQDKLDAAADALADAAEARERDRQALSRQYERIEARARRGIGEIVAAQIAEEGFDPHGYFVYFLWGSGDRPVYIGMSSNVLSRLGRHLVDAEKRYVVTRVTLLRCATEYEMNETEKRMITEYQPRLNTIGIRDVSQR